MTPSADGLAVSVQTRLVRHAKTLGVDPNLVLTRFAVERFLYRLSRSPHTERFVLKGALLLLAWLGETTRPTRDADLLGFGDLSDQALLEMFREICQVRVERDAMTYLPETVAIAPIRPEDAYGGRRVTVQARLGSARLRVQVDVGIGDVVTPAPEWLEYPALLDFPAPRLRSYPPETVIAEKLHAMVVLGSKNSRMRDFFDIDALAAAESFEGRRLADALSATFGRRRTALPDQIPLALTAEFAAAPEKEAQWQAFRSKNRLDESPETLTELATRVAAFLQPVIEAARTGRRRTAIWPVGGPWQEE
ncbi:MAG: nucleotidyl transferase AbiEii/AbiGii toxin family protein [Longimicrobiales bacterium]